ncbi:MAG: dephospho-CoA kinase [Spirochaetaceae bacterium]|jgi:dephospho-CoA kinase|nr:dephospho-CoA kinase [Spirochaetaceae bacterium]
MDNVLSVPNPPLIGLTGLCCAGKNYVASFLEEAGLAVLDLDLVGHRVLDREKEAIVREFGAAVVRADGSVDRKALGAVVFAVPEKLRRLEALVHPAVDRVTADWLNEHKGRICVLNAALLHKSAFFRHLRCLIIVKASFITRLIRAKRRDNLPFSVLLKRFKSQEHFAAQDMPQNADIHFIINERFFGLHFKATQLNGQIQDILSKIKDRNKFYG